VLEEIRIRGLGVIDDALLELAPGLTVVTGETGAGKTMVVTGLGLLFGGRADPGAVRPGSRAASVEGRLRLDPAGPVAARAGEAGGELDEDSLLLVRTVSAEGRSRAHVGGRSVPVGVLAELAESSIAVHGQSDQSRLLQPARQREALDRYAGEPVSAPLTRYVEAYDELQETEAELADLVTRARERSQEADVLRFGLDEIEAVDPQPGEAGALALEAARLGQADTVRAAIDVARAALLGGDTTEAADAVGLLGAARSALESAGLDDPELEALIGRLKEVGYLVADLGADLASYGSGIEADPARLAVVEERRAAVTRLLRKYTEEPAVADPDRDPVAEALAWAQRAAARLTTLEGDDDRIGALRARRDELRATMAAQAAEVSRARAGAAKRFAAAVSAELAALAMPNAEVQVDVRSREEYARHGLDDVELLLRPHAGAPARPVQKGASGGELSRVMLAIEVVFAGADPVPTFVFDEVDAGVGGKAAVEVGRRLAALARTAQVIVVTHLPQVAAFADQHLVVHKADDGSVTSSGVTRLDDSGRVAELSRMLAGQERSAAAQAHAEELLAAARDDGDTPG
jgi:DNA repair protein RecN (Recombination protein N)